MTTETDKTAQAAQTTGTNGTANPTPELSSHGGKSAAPVQTKSTQTKEGQTMTTNNNNQNNQAAAGQKANNQKPATTVVSLNVGRQDRHDSKKKASNNDWQKDLQKVQAKAGEPKPYNTMFASAFSDAFKTLAGDAVDTSDAAAVAKQLGELAPATVTAAATPAEAEAAEAVVAEAPLDEAAEAARAEASAKAEAAAKECAALTLGQAVQAVVKTAKTSKLEKDGQEMEIAISYTVDLLGQSGNVIRQDVPALGGNFEAKLAEGSVQEFNVMNTKNGVTLERNKKAIEEKAKAAEDAIAQAKAAEVAKAQAAARAEARKELLKGIKPGASYRGVTVVTSSKNGPASVRIDADSELDLTVVCGGYLKQGDKIDVVIYPAAGNGGVVRALRIGNTIDAKEAADWVASIGLSGQAVSRRQEDGTTVMDFTCPRNRDRNVTLAAPASARKGTTIVLKVTGVQVFKDSKTGTIKLDINVTEVSAKTRR